MQEDEVKAFELLVSSIIGYPVTLAEFTALLKQQSLKKAVRQAGLTWKRDRWQQPSYAWRNLDKELVETFSVRVCNCLAGALIHSFPLLALRSERSLMRLKNFGRRSLSEVRMALKARGMALKGE